MEGFISHQYVYIDTFKELLFKGERVGVRVELRGYLQRNNFYEVFDLDLESLNKLFSRIGRPVTFSGSVMLIDYNGTLMSAEEYNTGQLVIDESPREQIIGILATLFNEGFTYDKYDCHEYPIDNTEYYDRRNNPIIEGSKVKYKGKVYDVKPSVVEGKLAIDTRNQVLLLEDIVHKCTLV